MLDRITHKFWLQQAAKGNPPDPADVAREQYELLVPWFWRRHLIPMARKLGKDKSRKHKYTRRVARGGGKSQWDAFLLLYASEYVIPFLPNLRPANRRAIVIGRTQTIVAQDNMEEVMGMIAHHAPWLKTTDESLWSDAERVRGLKVPSGTRTWNRVQFDLTNGCQILGFGWDQNIRGKHVPLVILDDIVTEENHHRATAQKDFIDGAMLKALLAGGVFLNNCTPQTESDLSAVLASDPDWDSFDLPAEDVDGTLGYREANEREVELGLLDKSLFKEPDDWNCLFVQIYNAEQLRNERGTTRSSRSKYDREMLLKPTTDSTLLIHPNDWARSLDTSLYYADAGEGAFYAGLDPSGLKSDEAGIVVLRIDERGRRIPVYLDTVKRRDRGETDESALGRLYDAVKRAHRKFHPKWFVEDNGFQWAIKPAMRDELVGISMEGFHLGSNKHNEAVGWPMIRAVFESGKVVLPFGPTPSEVSAKTPEDDLHAVVNTRRLKAQFNGIRLIDGQVEEERGVANDLVSAFHLALKCAETAGEGESSIRAVVYKGNKESALRPRGAEFGNYGRQGPSSRVRDAARLSRRL